MTVYLIDGRALVEQQEQWTANRRFIFLLRSCRAPREISRSPRLAHKAPVMQAIRNIARIARMTNLKNSRLTKKNGQEGPPKALKSRKNRKTNKDFSCYVKRLST